MAKKENGNATKSFILRVDAEMMEAIEAWAVDEFRSTNGQIQYIWIKPYARLDGSKRNENQNLKRKIKSRKQ